MKKYLKFIIPLVVIALLCFMGYKVVSKINHKNKVVQNTKTIPAFSYENIKGGVFTIENLKKNIPTLFVYYNSECEYCNEEAQMIKENMGKLIDFQLVFISFEKLENIKAFATKYHLTTYDNVHFLSDPKASFATTFDVKSLPCLVLYDRTQKLIEKIKGQTKVETLIKKLAP